MINFFDEIDNTFIVEKGRIQGKGEDSFCLGVREESAFTAVCDGCGGSGSRKYPMLENRTGAYIASRTVSGAISDWFDSCHSDDFYTKEQFLGSINKYISDAYISIKPLSVTNVKVSSSLFRDMPTTLALAYVNLVEDKLFLHSVWAGDSRVYILDEAGLAQVSIDDNDTVDAFLNLTDDGIMTNVISSDGKYILNCKNVEISKPSLIFTATDGCFGYIPSPMEFEYMLIDNMLQSENIEAYKRRLNNMFSEYAGDDYSFGFMSFGMGTFSNMKEFFSTRYEYLKKEYIQSIEDNDTHDTRLELWKKYKKDYERFFDIQRD